MTLFELGGRLSDATAKSFNVHIKYILIRLIEWNYSFFQLFIQ